MLDKIKVLLVEDDLDFVYLIEKMITSDDALDFIAYAENQLIGIELAKSLQPDIVLMDLNLSKNDLDGIEVAKEIRLATNAKIILLTSFEQPEIIIKASKQTFASGYVFKSQCQTLTDIIKKTATYHTPQEQFIKELVLQDLTEAERGVLDMLFKTGFVLQSTVKTIANQKTNIFKKLGLKNTHELAHIFNNW